MTQRLTAWKLVKSVCVCPVLCVQCVRRPASVTLDMKRVRSHRKHHCSLGLSLLSECNWGKLNVATRMLLVTDMPHSSLYIRSSWFIMQGMQIAFTYTMLPNVQYVLQYMRVCFSQQRKRFQAETKLTKRLSKKQGISDKLQQYSQKPADLKIESTEKNRNWKRKSPVVWVFFLSFISRGGGVEVIDCVDQAHCTESQWLTAPRSLLPRPRSL